ncbi:H(+)/Cl(-) exchange transporter 3 [Ceratocystis fimbriata CBS 114723]|uniref:Chloride channel protein n=1 Tax=Ceratocystis fimbriata CBS 114723 TaxID=1035309 RepID=A0A2C5X000_9PEZI|nr:H(+)/Cl(-) exchange transporter 3 [Ceratocystis fimbriata CBS 114723]
MMSAAGASSLNHSGPPSRGRSSSSDNSPLQEAFGTRGHGLPDSARNWAFPASAPASDAARPDRAAYEDMTAIDWILEKTKERQRLRMLGGMPGAERVGLRGYIAQLADASQVWLVLIGTGLVVGALAACMDVATAWLGDLKMGFCTGADGGSFFLNRDFCCFGYDVDVGKKCAGWLSWSEALHMGTSRSAIGWLVEYSFFIALSVLFAYMAACLIRRYAFFAKHSGIPELKTVLGGFVMNDFLGGWTLAAKSFGLCLAVASGMWLGKEGPLVHVACCVANQFIRLFKAIDANEARRREVLAAAAAAGISVAFGSPIGGVLFSIETLSYFPDKTMWHAFVCAMTAAVMLQAIDPFRSGNLVLYQSSYTVDWHDFELVPYMLLGIFGGLYGGLFVGLNMAVQQWKIRLSHSSLLPSPVKQVVLVALVTAIVNYPNFYMKVPTSRLVLNLFTECAQLLDDDVGLCKTGAASGATVVLLLFAAVLAFALTAVTFGLHVPAGILLPSIAIGALVGRAFGIGIELFVRAVPDSLFFASCAPDVPCVTPGTYAVVGAAAALAGVTRMTVSIVVIMFELTGALTFVLPIMMAVMLSKWVGDALSEHSIYEAWIRFNGYPLIASEGSASSAAAHVPPGRAVDHMTALVDLHVLPATGHSITSLQQMLATSSVQGFPVVADTNSAVLLGYISRTELASALTSTSLRPETPAFFVAPGSNINSALDLRPWMDQTPLTLSAHAPMQLVVMYFQKLGVRYVLFVDHGILQGLLTRKDAWHVLNGDGRQEKQRARHEGDSGDDDGDDGGQSVGLLRGQADSPDASSRGESTQQFQRAYSIVSESGGPLL